MSDTGPRMPDPRMIPQWRAPRPARHETAASDPGGAEPDADETLVRPFLITSGRTQPTRSDLRVETLVECEPEAARQGLRFESQTITEVCRSPRSVAEIAVRLKVPLGVARVLIADLITAGQLRIPQTQDIGIDLLERIRDRVRAL